MVKYVLNSLYLTKQIIFVDIYQESNIYKPTKEIKNIKIDNLFNKFKEFYILNKTQNNCFQNNIDEAKNNINNLNDEKTKIKNIDDHMFFSYYVLLSNSKNIKHFLDKVNNFDLNIQLFIAFGIYLGIIRRIHLYFVIKSITNNEEIVKLMDGQHCEDDICVEKGINLERLKNIYEENKGGETHYFLYK